MIMIMEIIMIENVIRVKQAMMIILNILVMIIVMKVMVEVMFYSFKLFKTSFI